MSGRIIVVTSGKGGVGKTTCTVNIGTALARTGSKVVLIDTDIGLRNLDLLMGLENRIVYNVIDVIEERCKLKQALVKDKKLPNLSILAAAQTRDKSALDAEKLKELSNELAKTFDFVLIDCPAGIEEGFKSATSAASEAVIVTTPEMSAIRDADRIVGLLEAREDLVSYKLVINRLRPKMVQTNDMLDIDDVLEILSVKLLGVVPEDQDVIISTNKGDPIVNWDDSLASQAYRNIARRIKGEDVPLMNFDVPVSFFDKIKNWFSLPAKASSQSS